MKVFVAVLQDCDTQNSDEIFIALSAEDLLAKCKQHLIDRCCNMDADLAATFSSLEELDEWMSEQHEDEEDFVDDEYAPFFNTHEQEF